MNWYRAVKFSVLIYTFKSVNIGLFLLNIIGCWVGFYEILFSLISFYI